MSDNQHIERNKAVANIESSIGDYIFSGDVQWGLQIAVSIIKGLSAVDVVTKSEYDKVKAELDELKLMIKEGRFVEMPCKVGDKCYPIPRYKTLITERTISHITLSKRNTIIGFFENDGQYRPPLRTRILGKDIFLTKEAAEKALKERDGSR